MSAGANFVTASLVAPHGLVTRRAVRWTKPIAGLQLRPPAFWTIPPKASVNLVGTTRTKEPRLAHRRAQRNKPANQVKNENPWNERFWKSHRKQDATHEQTESHVGDASTAPIGGCNRAESITNPVALLHRIIVDYSRWRDHRLMKEMTERFHRPTGSTASSCVSIVINLCLIRKAIRTRFHLFPSFMPGL